MLKKSVQTTATIVKTADDLPFYTCVICGKTLPISRLTQKEGKWICDICGK